MPMVAAQRAGASFSQRSFIRGEERSWPDGKPPHGFAPDGSWVSSVAGVNADGSFLSGRDPSTGLYWPGDMYSGTRPVYFTELGPVPFIDPSGITGVRSDFTGWNLTASPSSAPIAVATAAPDLSAIDPTDTGSRAATFSATDVIQRAGGTPPPTPSRVFTLPTSPNINQVAPITGTARDTFLLNGVLTDGTGAVLNANRAVDDARPMTGDAAVTLKADGSYSPAQQLPTNNTTALAPTDWKKYLPYALGAVAIALAIYLLTSKKKGAATS